MAESAGGSLHDQDVKIPDVRISVENFGPIERGSIDLRPMSIFVGPSNTGKTYFSVLIYAIHKVLHGIFRFPLLGQLPELMDKDRHQMSDREIDALILEINEKRSISFFDLPEDVQYAAQYFLESPDYLADDLRLELESCFDIGEIESLIREPSIHNAAKISLDIREDRRRLWNFSAEISGAGIKSRGNIEDMILIPDHHFSSQNISDLFLWSTVSGLSRRYSKKTHHKAQIDPSGDSPEKVENIEYLVDQLNAAAARERSEIDYLPAARSGIMQSHRVIASSVMARSTRAGLERFSENLTFSSMVADFIGKLILYDDPYRRFRSRVSKARIEEMGIIADNLEKQTLGGHIRTIQSSHGGYPEFVYRPENSGQDIRLNRASSMVSELAPVILFIRNNVSIGDTLIIEEPEAHLHPAAQTEMAVALAGLVRVGVRVVITTHSDWLLQEIGNLMREGELAERTGDSQAAAKGALRPSDVGAWLFDKSGTDGGATVREIPFDRIEGIEPADYEDVAERLYNRSAELQNLFEEKFAKNRKKA